MARGEGRLIELERPPREERVIIEIGRVGRLAVPESREEPAVRAHELRREERHGPLGRLCVRGLVEGLRRLGERGDHEAVPRGEDLVVLVRVDPALTGRE